MNKFKLICGLSIKPKFCDLKSLFGDLRFQNIDVIVCLCFEGFFVFMQFFMVHGVCVIVSMFWAWIPTVFK